MGAVMAARYAEVAVDAPLPPERTLTYAIPPGMSVAPGQVVWAPLQSRRVSGVVFALSDRTEIGGVRSLGEVQDSSFALSPPQLALARWLSRETLCSLYEATALMLPWDFRRRLVSLLRSTEKAAEGDLSNRSDEERGLLAALHPATPAEERRLVRSSASRTALRRLLREGMVVREWRWERPRATPQYRATLRWPCLRGRRSSMRLTFSTDTIGRRVPGSHSLRRPDCGPQGIRASAVATLQRRGLVAVDRRYLHLAISVHRSRLKALLRQKGPAGVPCRHALRLAVSTGTAGSPQGVRPRVTPSVDLTLRSSAGRF